MAMSCPDSELQKMNCQIFRIGSFKEFPQSSPVSTLQLASVGFYFTGKKDQVKCFSCGLLLEDWGPENKPADVHKLYSPDCEFLKNNIPFTGQAPEQNNKSAKFQSGNNQTSMPQYKEIPPQTTKLQSLSTGPDRAKFMSGNSLPPTPQADSHNSQTSFQIHSNQGDFATRQVPATNQARPYPASSSVLGQNTQNQASSQYFLNGRDGEAIPTLDWSKDYRYERSRHNSYFNWPSNAAVRPNELAEAGFFYTGTDDRVQCVFCRGILRNWEPDDSPIAEHRRHFGQCPFLLDPSGVGNIPLGQEKFQVGDSAARQLPTQAAMAFTEDYCRGIITEKPVHNMYSLPAERLATFKDFPTNMTQTPEMFTRAGFFYTGISDHVKCFFCDGGLRNWEPNDEPWTEHARWFPRCGFLRLCKGDEYIKEVQQRFAPPPENKRPSTLRSPNAQPLKVDEKQYERLISGKMAKSALEMGWSEGMVQRVIRRRLEDIGEDFPNTESLLDAIGELEQEDKYIEAHGESDNSLETEVEVKTIENGQEANKENKKKPKKRKNKKKKNAGNSDNSSSATNDAPNEPYQYMDDDEAKRLADDVQRMKDERLCKVCMDEEVNIVFLRCGHLVCCSNCAPALRHCPICRELIRGTVRVFLS